MNNPRRVIGFVNAAHFVDHYAMLIFAAAVIIMGPALGMAYAELLPYATPGFVAFGAGALLTGWLGDRWSRRHMMLIFYLGIGLSMISVGLVQTPWQLGAALFAIGLFASIYHPVGTAMLVSYADRLGRDMGLNGVFGNLGVATGIVDNDVLLALPSKLQQAKENYVARVAIVHHHVLPIAFAPNGHKTTGEPMMVFRNAGALLRILANHQFDLILHGHWHKTQFARIDFGDDSSDGYPMAVVSAGSAAMATPDNTNHNSINLIRIAPTGQIEVKSVFYGAGQSPRPDGTAGADYRVYKEPLAAAKRRAHARARERHPIECEAREQRMAISG